MQKLMSCWLRPATVIIFFAAMLVTTVPEVMSKRYIVGGNWTSNVKYTIWSQNIHFYRDDRLFFVYYRNQMSVLEVNKTNYETCNYRYPIHNWTTGAGRDVVPLNVTREYYFISGNGFCYAGVKVAIQLEVPLPPPSPSPIKDHSLSFPPLVSPMNDHSSRFPPSVSPEFNDASKVTPSTAPLNNYSPSFPPLDPFMNERPSLFSPSVSPQSSYSSKVAPSTAPVNNYSPRCSITSQNIVIPAIFVIAVACMRSGHLGFACSEQSIS